MKSQKENKMKPFKIRCSSIGSIMSTPKGVITDKQIELMKSFQEKEKLTPKQALALLELEEKYNDMVSGKVPLSETAKSYVEDWVKSELFGRRKDFESKYTIKGNDVEEESIKYYMKIYGIEGLTKNEEQFENEWCVGTPDVLQDPLDIKNSWDVWTFPLFEDDIPNNDYFWQLQGYMWLKGWEKMKLVYSLLDTPDELIADEYNKRKKNIDPEKYGEIFDEVIKDMTFGDIEDKYKIRIFEVERDDEAIKQIIEKVKNCRTYQQELLKKLSNF